MIVNFSVKNFNSIKDKIILSFEPENSDELEKYYMARPDGKKRVLKLGIIYGPNASGKTNILLALNFLRNTIIYPFYDKSKRFLFLPFLFDDKTPKKSTQFEIEFINNKVRYLYYLELNQFAVISEELYYFKKRKALVYERKTDLDKQISNIEFGSTIKITKEAKEALLANTLWNNTVLGGFLKTNIDQTELREVMRWFQNRLMFMVNNQTMLYEYMAKNIDNGKIRKDIILDVLKKADINITDILFEHRKVKKSGFMNPPIVSSPKTDYASQKEEYEEEEKIDIYFNHKVNDKIYPFPFLLESAGTRRYFELGGFLSLLIADNKIVPIDELESSLHPDLIKHFILTFLVNSRESQLIVTTHHRELLMEKNILRRDAIWFTERKDDGSTELFSLSDFNSSVIRNTSSFYNVYKSGRLGAIPNLKDYYLDFDNEEKEK